MVDPERIFRSALEAPAPPEPPVPDEEDDDGDDEGHHIHLRIVPPLVLVLRDGSVRTDGPAGTALVVACTVAAFVVVWQAIRTVFAWLGATVIAEALIAGVTFGIIVAVWVGTGSVLYLAYRAIARWWRDRRAP